jgi:TonB family protein
MKIFNAETQRRRDAESKKVKNKNIFYFLLFTFYFKISASLRLCVLIFLLATISRAQKIAVLVPEKTERSLSFAEKFETSLSAKFKVLDASLSETAFRSASYETPFNLTTKEAKIIGARLGCDYFLLVKAANQRRSTFAKSEFYESYAAVYVVSARTGRLVFWTLKSFEAEREAKADKDLLASTNDLSAEIFEKLKTVSKDELNENRAQNIEELPAEESAETKNFRPPLPYKRMKPEYTKTAYLYSIEATVEIEIEVDETGKLLKTEIVRWAGFGLDESVTETIRKMQWRAADRNGKTLPMRVLLRYNFKKPEKD